MAELQIHPEWCDDPDGLLDAVRGSIAYGPGEDRATGYLYGDGQPWTGLLAEAGPRLLDDLEDHLGVRFEMVAFQGYRDGSGCDWHTDSPFDSQAVLSLGVTRTFGVRRPGQQPVWLQVGHGDLVVMPAGFQKQWEHCVPVEVAPGERCSLVFRTVARG